MEPLLQSVMVGIKRVVDYNVRVRAKPDGSGMATEGLKTSINPFDEIAIEAALRLREAGAASEVVLATVGPPETERELRTGLAMGADRAIRVDARSGLEPLTVARVLCALARRVEPGLVVLGKQAVDDDHGVQCCRTLAFGAAGARGGVGRRFGTDRRRRGAHRKRPRDARPLPGVPRPLQLAWGAEASERVGTVGVDPAEGPD